MMGDVADYGEWKTGRRATGTVTAAVVFALWIGLALGGAIAGWLLSFYGYEPNAVQSDHALMGIRPDRICFTPAPRFLSAPSACSSTASQ